MFADFPKDAGPLADAVRDDDAEVRLTALSILVDLAHVRDRLQHLAAGATPLPSAEPGTGGPTPTEGKKIPPPEGKQMPPEAMRDFAAALILVAAEEPARDKSQQQAFEDLARGLDKTIGPLVERLGAPDVATRRMALDVLELLGTAAFPAVDGLTASLHDPDRFVRWAAARTLGALAQAETDKQKFTPAQADAAVRGMADLLRDQDVGVRLAALTALQHFGPHARPAAATLTRMLNRSQTDAALALVPTAESDPDLVKGDPNVRINAFRALEAIDGDETVQALPEAEVALGDPTTLVRQAAADFIGRVGQRVTGARREELIRVLGGALSDEDGDVRRSASGALLRLTAKPK